MDEIKFQQRFFKIIEPQVSQANFRLCFSKIKFTSVNNNKILITTPSAFIQETLKKHHLELIEDSLKVLLEKPAVVVEFTVNHSEEAKEEVDFFQIPVSSSNGRLTNNPINPKYTLENFVVGLSNNVAYAAAQAVVQNPGTSYNPLFIYGGTGVGKTHLMLAIGNALLSKNKGLKIVYCPSETFMNDYVEAIQTHRMGDVRSKYRSLDIFLVDDIQFFSGREGTQEEFFHTFNELAGKNSQIILTSDKPPHEIAKLEDRLKSRLAGGLMIDIQPPDFDTRIAILRAKCLEHGDDLSEEVLSALASSFDTNIRELEGKLTQILQSLKAHNLPPTIENVSKFLQNTHQQNIKIDPKLVLATIGEYFHLNQKDLISPRRQKELVLPRHIAMFLLSEELKLTVENIGRILGGRDHTTVMHGRDKIKKLANTDREIQKILIEIKAKLLN